MNENEKYVELSPKMEPEFFAEIMPTLQPWIMLVAAHIVYFYTGNMMIVPWVTYTCRAIYDYFWLDD